METAQPLATSLGLEVLAEEGVIEVNYGEWQGANLKTLSKLPEWKMVQHFPSTFRFPGGESLREVQNRAVVLIERLRGVHANQTVALFSHGDVIRTTLAHYLGTPLDLFQRVIIQTASISVLSFVNDMPAVLAMNYVAELPIFAIKRTEEPPVEEKNTLEPRGSGAVDPGA